MKPDVTKANQEEALWFPDHFNWGPSQTEPVATDGGGTVVWSSDESRYIFVTPPSWWSECRAGDSMPDEWSVF